MAFCAVYIVYCVSSSLPAMRSQQCTSSLHCAVTMLWDSSSAERKEILSDIHKWEAEVRLLFFDFDSQAAMREV